MQRGGRRNPLAPFKTKKMMIKKTYGVLGVTEWYCIVKSPFVSLKVPFTGGIVTASGVTPAEYTTDNPVFQHLIETSDYFKMGRILLIRKYDAVVTEKERKQIAEAPVAKSEPEAPVASNDDLQVVQVTCTEDAKQYMREHYGCNAADVRSKLQITRLAAEKGIRFEGWD